MTHAVLSRHINTMARGRVLISGAGIEGPALAFWLNRYGFTVTVVEKASALHGGGYPIDVRGTALEVVRRMGILPQLRNAQIDLRLLTFLDADGAAVNPHTVIGGVAGRDLDVLRMPRWSKGRVTLVGDAAYAPSFLTRQGSGADIAAYEHDIREFVTVNQDQVGEGDAIFLPTTARAVEQRNDMLRSLSVMPSGEGRPAHSALTLPEFTPVT
ncbi:hypothetical protein ACWD3I_24420 [Streptomyces sp. NPDC002817]|uniref:hypothetical protein n=1 Tax=Streptomyces sp. NPDC088357 TaxID=3154655 RepID=UPI00341441C1